MLPHEYGDYIIFVDESGDHGLQSIDTEYPLFALVFVIIKKQDYLEKIIPSFIALKFKYWGHDQVILHESDIRKERGTFGLLRTNNLLRESFYEDLNTLIAESPFVYVAAAIKKDALKKKYITPYNPYEIGMLFCMEETLIYLNQNNQEHKHTALVVEGRGQKENNELELEFRRICDNQRQWGKRRFDFTKTPFNLVCVDKKCNSTGLQLADLIARPIGLRVLRPTQENRAMRVIREKQLSLKIFP